VQRQAGVGDRATRPDGRGRVHDQHVTGPQHLSTQRPDGDWLVELRRDANKATVSYAGGTPGQRYALPMARNWCCGNGSRGNGCGSRGCAPTARCRISCADMANRSATGTCTPVAVVGLPDRVRDAPGQRRDAQRRRPFTDRLVTRLVAAGIVLAPVLLHTGVASPEAHERPYPERFAVSADDGPNRQPGQGRRRPGDRGRHDGGAGTGKRRRRARRAGGGGLDGLIVTPERGVRAVDGLLTGFHEPRASHLDLLAAIAPPALLDRCYAAAIDGGYLWHEFGDVNLLLPG